MKENEECAIDQQNRSTNWQLTAEIIFPLCNRLFRFIVCIPFYIINLTNAVHVGWFLYVMCVLLFSLIFISIVLTLSTFWLISQCRDSVEYRMNLQCMAFHDTFSTSIRVSCIFTEYCLTDFYTIYNCICLLNDYLSFNNVLDVYVFFSYSLRCLLISLASKCMTKCSVYL